MYITKNECDNLSDCIDFISNNSDGAEDHEYYANMVDLLMTLHEKAKKSIHKRESISITKKALKIARTLTSPSGE